MKPERCRIEDCDLPVLARGLCSKDYQRAKAAGTLDEIAPNPSRNCEHCGQPIPPGRRWGAAFCSTDCKQASVDARRHAHLIERRRERPRACAWCREPLTPELRFGTRFCSRQCSDAWNNDQKRLSMLAARKVRRGPCEACGQPIPERRHANAIYCSPECKLQANRSHHPKVSKNRAGYNREYLYGITPEQFEAMLAAQGNRCAVCRDEEWPGIKGKGPQADHDHVTGQVRGLLCGRCNAGIRDFRDDAARLRAAAAYLEGPWPAAAVLGTAPGAASSASTA